MNSEPRDTLALLLARDNACPACGAELARDAPGCAACGRSFLRRYHRPRSATTRALAGAWAIGASGALLVLLGVLFQLLGVVERSNSLPVLRALLIGGVLGLGLCTLMAWGCYTRFVWALYAGALMALALGVAGLIGAARLGGPLGLALATGGLLGSGALLFMHVAVAGEFRGELRRESFVIAATSAHGLAREGREFLLAGLPFLAAQCWARALGKQPGNADYMHALGLALARLGYAEPALAQLSRALSIQPDNAEFRRSYATVLQRRVG